MSATEKYQSLIDLANQLGVADFSASETDGVLTLSGSTNGDGFKQLNDLKSLLDPMGSGDLVMGISASETYTVESGDSLSKIAGRYGTTWQAIFEANRDTIDDPDMIQVGQVIRIPL
jgi:nucleoid-associated protein YgaU